MIIIFLRIDMCDHEGSTVVHKIVSSFLLAELSLHHSGLDIETGRNWSVNLDSIIGRETQQPPASFICGPQVWSRTINTFRISSTSPFSWIPPIFDRFCCSSHDGLPMRLSRVHDLLVSGRCRLHGSSCRRGWRTNDHRRYLKPP